MNPENVEISEEKLNELEKKTKDTFTKVLIFDLRKKLNSKNDDDIFKIFSFNRIVNLVAHENKRNKLSEFKKNKYKDVTYGLRVFLRGKKRDLSLNGEFLLSEISDIIQKEFDLEPMHLYEFEIGGYKFGPECDEWQEIFDSLDDYKIGAAISIAGLKVWDRFKFLYDFGDKIKFKIEITDIKKLNLDV